MTVVSKKFKKIYEMKTYNTPEADTIAPKHLSGIFLCFIFNRFHMGQEDRG